MARRRNAVLRALFNYGQSTVGMILGLVVTRTVLHLLGTDTWGLWAASGSLLSYAGLADLGVLGVLPWVIADADGRRDHERIRASLSHGMTFASLSGLTYAAVAFLLWRLYPSLLQLSPHDQNLLQGPVFTVVILTALTFPLRVFTALLTGVQDVTFLGMLGLAQTVGTSVLTFILAWSGLGLYALAVGVALPPALSALASVLRANVSFRDLARGWPRPVRSAMTRLAFDGFGAWLCLVGFSLAAAADPVILSNAGLRGLVASFVLTSRLPMTLTQFGWILPDSALIGLAQLNAETNRDRVREVARAILRLNMVLAGIVASAVLASNAGFVRFWVGRDLFMGASLNALLAANTVLMTTVHGLVTIASVLGKRMTVGLAFVANGVLHVAVASFLSRRVGVYGVAAATFLSGTLTTLVVGLYLVEKMTGLTVRDVVTRVLGTWLLRFAPLGAIAFYIGWVSPTMPFALLVVCCSAFGFAYLFWMKPLYVGLPLGPRVTAWLTKLRLLPQASA